MTQNQSQTQGVKPEGPGNPGSFGALSDLTVIDLTRYLAGPFCTQILADHGARIIKVEEPEGDPAREVGPFLPDDKDHFFGGYFQSINRNKRSIVVDMKTAEGIAVLKQLVAKADVLVENFRPGVMEKLGLGFESLLSLNPRLVYVAISGYGNPRTGQSPYAQWPAFDITAQAGGGLAGVTGPSEDEPTRIGPSVGDLIPGVFAAVGLLAAVHESRRSGQGQYVDIAMQDAILAVCERIVYRYSYEGHVSRPEGNDHPLVRPFGIFPASDGKVSIAAAFGRSWDALCVAMGRDDLLHDSRFLTIELRRSNTADLNGIVCRWTSTRTCVELERTLGGKVPFSFVSTAKDIFESPHFKARSMLVPVSHPGSSIAAEIANTPIRMTRTPGGIHAPAPRLDEHREEILSELGIRRGESNSPGPEVSDVA